MVERNSKSANSKLPVKEEDDSRSTTSSYFHFLDSRFVIFFPSLHFRASSLGFLLNLHAYDKFALQSEMQLLGPSVHSPSGWSNVLRSGKR